MLFTWIYDSFNEVPYLRVRGDYGSGKSRFLLTVGSLCYRPIFASGASTVSPIFRILDSMKGTLIVDEGDFRVSDEKAEVVKILNNGNARGFPVLRSEQTPSKEFNPTAYSVFGPKLVATRGFFEDRALESRCITEELGGRRLRNDIPLNLPASFHEEALRLRNKLLLYRFRNRSLERLLSEVEDRTLEPRVSQIFAPLLATVNSPEARERVKLLAQGASKGLTVERSGTIEAQVVEVLSEFVGARETVPLKEDHRAVSGAVRRRPGAARVASLDRIDPPQEALPDAVQEQRLIRPLAYRPREDGPARGEVRGRGSAWRWGRGDVSVGHARRLTRREG